LWGGLSADVKGRVVAALRKTRVIRPYINNWMLFAATIEAALWHFSDEHDHDRITDALRAHETWYKGDGA
jgi:hypothetical protein